MIIDLTRIFPDSLIRMLFEAILWTVLFQTFSEIKGKKILVFILTVFCPWATLSLITIIYQYPNGYGGLVMYICFFIIYLLFYEGRVLQKILYFFISFALYFIITIFAAALSDLLFKDIWKFENGLSINQFTLIPFLYTYISPIILAFPVNGILRYFIKKKSKAPITKYTLGYLFMPLSQLSFFFILAAVVSEMYNYGLTLNINNDYKFFIPVSVTFALSLIADIYIFSMVDKTETANRKNIELMAQINKNEVEYNSVLQMKQDNESLRRIRHDIINQNMSLSILIKNGKIDEAIKMLSSIEESIESTISKSYCSNNLINAILQLEASKAKKAAVDLEIQADCHNNLNMDMADLSSLLTNIIDNAIEASTEADGEKAVKFVCKAINSNLIIHTENPFLSTKEKNKSFFKSKKADTAAHGIGLKIVERIIKKYNGKIDYNIFDNKFILDAVITV